MTFGMTLVTRLAPKISALPVFSGEGLGPGHIAVIRVIICQETSGQVPYVGADHRKIENV